MMFLPTKEFLIPNSTAFAINPAIIKTEGLEVFVQLVMLVQAKLFHDKAEHLLFFRI